MKRIAVITRTKNRALLLSRCLDSLKKQTYKDFLWVIVNDNGNIAEVDSIASKAVEFGILVQVIHRSKSLGVAAAANDGILSSDSEFIHLHDDDDTIEPIFYEEVITFLDNKPHYAAVITGIQRINEEISGDQITLLNKEEFRCPDNTLFISDLICKNQFTTNSFVYRRSSLKLVGLFDETLPVLEDWDFNLRYIRHYDIGVIPKFLANYHWRRELGAGGTPQTITSGMSLHQEYTAIIRNKLLRQDISSGKIDFGTLMALGRYHQLESNTLSLINDKLDALLLLRRLFKKVIKFIPFSRLS